MKSNKLIISVPFEQRDKLCNSLMQVLLHIDTKGMPGDMIEINFRNVNRSNNTENVKTLIINLN